MAERELLLRVTADDCVWDKAFRGSGKGGQARNKTSSGQRCHHRPSGAVGESTASRSQLDNRREAFNKMIATAEFQQWLQLEILRRNGAAVLAEEAVEQAMAPRNLRVEVHDDNGRWVEAHPDTLEPLDA